MRPENLTVKGREVMDRAFNGEPERGLVNAINSPDTEGSRWVTKDSGVRDKLPSGMVRDTQFGKPRFDLIIPKELPFEEQLLTRWAALMARGAEKYEDRNWEKGGDQEALERARSSAFRHFMQWFCGEDDEDHAAAVLFNMQAAILFERKLNINA